jgi:lipopolysaccharide/colanic/teichoic acid biosynthesis glycosyltransferase
MTNERDTEGNLLPDDKRLPKYGKLLRASSADELGELLNIIKGDMAVVGPRPWAVSYLDYFTPEEHQRHSVRPGLTGLAQVNGRTAANWGERLGYDTKYVKDISFVNDAKIIISTVKKVFVKSDIVEAGCQGDFDEYRRKQWDDGIVSKPVNITSVIHN